MGAVVGRVGIVIVGRVIVGTVILAVVEVSSSVVVVRRVLDVGLLVVSVVVRSVVDVGLPVVELEDAAVDEVLEPDVLDGLVEEVEGLVVARAVVAEARRVVEAKSTVVTSGRSTPLVGGMVVDSTATVDDGKISVRTEESPESMIRRPAITARTASNAMGTTLLTMFGSLPQRDYNLSLLGHADPGTDGRSSLCPVGIGSETIMIHLRR